jgi:putative ABC transport system substrate-binding protein
MRRRDFIRGISVWTALPRAARAQSRERKRRVAVLMGGLLSGDLDGQAEAAALEAGLTELGWKLGGNIELEYRWPGAELDQVSIAANEIVAMRPDLVVSRLRSRACVRLTARSIPSATPIKSCNETRWQVLPIHPRIDGRVGLLCHG